MRILLVVHQFFPDFRAGTETLTRRTAEEMQRRGHQVWILAAGPREPGRQPLRHECWQGLSVIRLNPPADVFSFFSAVGRSYEDARLVPLFCSVLEQLAPDVVHVLHLRRHTISFLDAARDQGVPVIASLTDYWFACPTGQLQFPQNQPCSGPQCDGANCLQHLTTRVIPPLAWLPNHWWRLLMGMTRWFSAGPLHDLSWRLPVMQKALSRCDTVLVPSRLMQDTFGRLGFCVENFEQCPYGIDLVGLADLPGREPWGGEACRPLRVGFIGSFNYAKGAHVLLEAIRHLGPHFQIQVRLYGNPKDDPVYYKELRRLAEVCPQVDWCGVFASEQVFSVLSGLDLLVVPSLWRENAPLIVLQALAAGLPLLLSDVEGMADQVRHGHNALLFPPGDSTALAELLKALHERPDRLEALINHGGQARSMAHYGDQVEALYARVQLG